MSGSLHTWYSLSDLDVLAGREAVLEGALELGRLVRLNEFLNADAGSVKARMAFHQHQDGIVLFELECTAELELICQRCLEPVMHKVHTNVDFAVLETDSLASCSPETHELIVMNGDRFSPATIIEDELIVSLPLAPRHANPGQCGRLARDLEKMNCEARENGMSSDVPSADH